MPAKLNCRLVDQLAMAEIRTCAMKPHEVPRGRRTGCPAAGRLDPGDFKLEEFVPDLVVTLQQC